MELIEEMSTANKNHAIVVFIDLKNAFDTVYHGIRMKKFNYCDVHGVANYCFKSYLLNRKQFININVCVSEVLDVTYGVPQGSIFTTNISYPLTRLTISAAYQN